MAYIMRLTETVSRQTVEREYPGGYREFWWTDGNFGCDCNRKIEWCRAHGMSEERIAELWKDGFPCGDSAYEAEYVSGDVADP